MTDEGKSKESMYAIPGFKRKFKKDRLIVALRIVSFVFYPLSFSHGNHLPSAGYLLFFLFLILIYTVIVFALFEDFFQYKFLLYFPVLGLVCIVCKKILLEYEYLKIRQEVSVIPVFYRIFIDAIMGVSLLLYLDEQVIFYIPILSCVASYLLTRNFYQKYEKSRQMYLAIEILLCILFSMLYLLIFFKKELSFIMFSAAYYIFALRIVVNENRINERSYYEL